MEWPVRPCLYEQPVDHGGPVAGADEGDIVAVGGGEVRRHLGDQRQEEGHVVGLARLVVDVPAPLIATGRHDHHSVAEVAQAAHVALAPVSWRVEKFDKKISNPLIVDGATDYNGTGVSKITPFFLWEGSIL